MIDMRNKITEFTKLSHIKVYREDILELEAIMADNLKSDEVLTIKYEDKLGREHAVKTLAGVDQLTEISKISIERPTSSLILNLRTSQGANFYSWVESDINYAIMLKVLALLNDCRSKVRTVISSLGFKLGFFLIALPSIFVIVSAFNNDPHQKASSWVRIVMVASLVLGFTFVVFNISVDFSKNSFITLSSRNTVNFYQRNRDRIFTGLITGLLVALLTIIFTKLLN